MKYSKVSGNLRWTGGTIVLHRGQSIDDDHPLVEERPDLWSDEEPGAQIQGEQSRVQTGMQRPGEVRQETAPVIPTPRGTNRNRA